MSEQPTKREMIVTYLQTKCPKWIGPSEIGEAVFGRCGSSTVSRLCKKLVADRTIERSDKGLYRAKDNGNG